MDKVESSIKNIRELEKFHMEVGAEIMNGAGGKLYTLDILAIAVINRSLALLHGFCDLIEKKNFTSAAPLIRLQLDNLLRFHGSWLVENPHDFAMSVLAGEKISNMKDRDGNNMTDRYLVEKISIDHPELQNVYKETSGFIHLSEKHIFASLGQLQSDGKFQMKASATDAYVSERDYLIAIRAFFEITQVLFSYLKGWAITKDGRIK